MTVTSAKKRLTRPQILGKRISTILYTIFTVTIISSLSLQSGRVFSKDPAFASVHANGTMNGTAAPLNGSLTSPFKNTLAIIRVTSPDLAMRIPKLMAYRPFFYDIHISIEPHLGDTYFNNLTYDNAGGCCTTYASVGDTMAGILQANETDPVSQIEGILYFHFDMWVDPLGFAREDFNNLWILDGPAPNLKCMRDVTGPDGYSSDWPGVNGRWWEHARKANAEANALNIGFKADELEWCAGWSDMYYVPRRFWPDFTVLSRLYKTQDFGSGVNHEVAIPTMFRTLDRTHRAHKHLGVTSHIGDCWGSCCHGGATATEVLEARCGHHLDWRSTQPVKAAMERLRVEEMLLGSAAVEAKERQWNATRMMEAMLQGDERYAMLRGPIEEQEPEEGEDEQQEEGNGEKQQQQQQLEDDGQTARLKSRRSIPAAVR